MFKFNARACAASFVVLAFAAQAHAGGTEHLQEGTEIKVHFNDKLSSKTASEGDRFSITLDEPIVLSDGTRTPAGYRGAGEVTTVEKRGMMGKPGQLNVRINYIKIGDTRVHLRGSKGEEGKSGIGATIALTVLFGPLGLLKHGHDVEIQRGQSINVFVDQDTDVPMPIAPPPTGDDT